MEPWQWIALLTAWPATGALFVALLRRLGFDYEIRSDTRSAPPTRTGEGPGGD